MSDLETEKDSSLVSEKKNPMKKHYSNIRLKSDLEKTDLISDVTLIKNNIAPYVFVNEKNVPLPNTLDQQIIITENVNNEMLTMMMMLLLIVIVGIVMFLLINTVEKNSSPNNLAIYKLTSEKVNSDPLLSKHRYMI